MSFVAPWWLALWALAPVVVLLHLRRRTAVEVPSTWLWRAVSDGAESMPRLQRPPSSRALWLQLLALTVAGLALSEPRWGADERGDHVVVVLDGGVAMTVRDGEGGERRFDEAVAQLLEAIAGGPHDRVWSVWWAGPVPRPLALEQTRGPAIERLLQAAEPTDDRTDWARVADAVAGSLRSETTLVVMTATPGLAEQALGATAASVDGTLEIASFARPFENLSIERVSATAIDPSDERWRIVVAVRADGNNPGRDSNVSLVARFLPVGSSTSIVVDRVPLAFNLGGRATAERELSLPGLGVLIMAFETEDAFPADDAFHLGLNPSPEAPKVGLLTAQGPGSPTQRMLEALEGYDTVVFAPDEATDTALGDLDLLVVEGAADPFAGNPGLQRPPAILWLGTGPGVVTPANLVALDPAVTDWRVDHPLARGTSWGTLDVERALGVKAADNAETVVAGLHGPLVSLTTRGLERDAVVAFDPADERWTASTGFLTFVADAVDWLAQRPSTTQACTVGASCVVPLGGLGGTRIEHLGSGTYEVWPDLSGVVRPAVVDRGFVPTKAGLWRFQDGNGERDLPVNLSQTTSEAIAEAAAAEHDVRTVPTLAARSPWWATARWWVALLVGLLLLEGVWAGLAEERFWRRGALKGVGLATRRRRSAAMIHAATVAIGLLALVGAWWPRWAEPRTIVVITDATTPYDAGPAETRVTVPIAEGSALDAVAAVRAALAHVDPASQARIVLSSRTPPTRGEPWSLLPELTERDVPVDVRPAQGLAPRDVLVERVWLDRIPRVGDSATLQGVLVAERPTEAQLLITRDGADEATVAVALAAGTTIVQVPVTFAAAGRVRFVLAIEASNDPTGANDRAELVVDVTPAPTIHVYTSDGERGERFADSLRLQGLDVRSRPPHTAPVTVQDYSGVDGVVLLNVPALELTTLQQNTLEAYVRETGGGLTIVGGERAFGPGGYHRTTLDQVSPLAAQVPREAPEVAMLFVLDRSGSMQQLVGGATRLDVAREAVLAAIELLGEQSQVAIVVFDEVAQVVLPFTSTSDTTPIAAALANLVPGGGTSMYPALELARDELATSEAATKHVVVLTDGLSQPGDFASSVISMRELGATVSGVAIGDGSDVAAIQQLVALGGGLAHTTTDFQALPGILAQEAMMLAGDPVVEGPVVPRRTAHDPGLMAGIPETMPPLAAFVETTAKADAKVLLEDAEGRPIMATWRYGAGQVLAFGAHGIGPWVDDWTALAGFPGWWSQWVRWTTQPPVRPGLEGRAHVVGDEVWVDVVARTEEGVRDADRTLSASLRPMDGNTGTDPNETVIVRRMMETDTGRYEIRLPLDPGAWEVVVATDGAGTDALVIPVAHAYAARHASNRWASEALLGMARASGGRVLLGGEPAWPDGTTYRWSLERGAWREWLVVAVSLWFGLLMVRYAPGWLGVRRAVALLGRRRPRSDSST